MIPSVIGIVVTAVGLYLVYVGVHGGPNGSLPVYPVTGFGVAPNPTQPQGTSGHVQ